MGVYFYCKFPLLLKHGETPIHIAAWDGQSGLLDLLCRFSQDLNGLNLVGQLKLKIKKREFTPVFLLFLFC
jgi:ankyrin repeat protein